MVMWKFAMSSPPVPRAKSSVFVICIKTILISLRETKSKGDIEDFYIERTVKNGFAKKEEWWQVGIWCKTHKLKLSTLFPKDRHCKRAILQTRTDNKTVVLGPEHF